MSFVKRFSEISFYFLLSSLTPETVLDYSFFPRYGAFQTSKLSLSRPTALLLYHVFLRLSTALFKKIPVCRLYRFWYVLQTRFIHFDQSTYFIHASIDPPPHLAPLSCSSRVHQIIALPLQCKSPGVIRQGRIDNKKSRSFHFRTVRLYREYFPDTCGADYEARTRYLHLGKVALYQMS